MLAVESVRLNRTCTPEVHLMSSQPSFFGSLFDFSFSRFVTLRLVKFFYVVAMIVLALVMLVVIAFGFTVPVCTGERRLVRPRPYPRASPPYDPCLARIGGRGLPYR